jgi:hypothetical protein
MLMLVLTLVPVVGGRWWVVGGQPKVGAISSW